MIQIQHIMNNKNYMGGCTKLNVTDFFLHQEAINACWGLIHYTWTQWELSSLCIKYSMSPENIQKIYIICLLSKQNINF